MMTRKRKNQKAAKTVQPESLRWVDHVNRSLNSAAARQSQTLKKEKVPIKLAGHKGTCSIDKDKLVKQSEYFRAMLSAGFQVGPKPCSRSSVADLNLRKA